MASVASKRAAAATAFAAGLLGSAAATLHGLAPLAAEAAPAAPAPLAVDELPEWLAPGASVAVSGWAGSMEAVSVSADGVPVGRARAGRLGRVRLTLRAPRRPGRYELVLHGQERSAPLPRLLVRPITIAAVGDVNLGDRIGSAIRDFGVNYPWTSAAPLLRVADIAVANLECAVSTRGSPGAKMYTFRGEPAAVRGLAGAGVDVVSVANNHSLDFGLDAFLDTLRHLKSAGVAVAGGGPDLAAARRPAVFGVGGLRVAVLGYSDVRPYGFDASADRPGAAPADPEAVAVDVRRARRQADLVLVYFHWGVELAFAPDARQRTLAAAALTAGATVVLGAHPHVLQPVERTGRRLVAWSLGNFVFGATSPGTSTTGVLTLGLDSRGVRWSELVPARIEGVRPVLDDRRLRSALKRLYAARAN